MGHHQHRGRGRAIQLCEVAANQTIIETTGLLHQLQQGLETPPVGLVQFQVFWMLAPETLLLGEALTDLLPPQSAPGSQIDLQQVVAQLGLAG